MDIWASSLQSGFRIGRWTVLPRQCLLQSDGEIQHLEPKVMEVLVYLAASGGEVVRRDRLIEDVWRTIVSDEVLSRAVSLLRAHLGDDARLPSYIQTLPKLGYRCIAPITPLADAREAELATASMPSPGPEVPEPDPAAATTAPAGQREAASEPPVTRRPRPAWLLAGVLVLGALLLLWRSPWAPRSPVADGAAADVSHLLDRLQFRGRDPADISAIAVLPFEDLSRDAELGYLGESITDEIILALSKVDRLHVVARRNTATLRGRDQDTRRIGNLLAVDAVLEGTVKRDGDRLRVTAQLSNARSGYVIWAETYDEPLGQVFELQTRFTGVVVGALRAATAKDLRAPEASATLPSLAAYQAFLYGRHLLKLRGEDALRASIAAFGQALADSPGYARARLGLARALALLPHYSTEPEQAYYARALSQLDGMTLGDSTEQGEAESIRAFIADRRWQWIDAEAHHLRALELNPEDPNAYIWYSQHLASLGRTRDALAAARRGKDLDSVSPVVNDRLAVASLWSGEEAQAAEAFATGAELGFTHSLHPGYFVFLHRQRRFDESRRLFARILAAGGRDPGWLDALYPAFEGRGDTAGAVAAVEKARADGQLPPRLEFGLWTLLGETDRAYATLERFATQPRYLDLEFLFAPESAALRADPRFAALTQRLGMDAYWRRFRPPDIGVGR